MRHVVSCVLVAILVLGQSPATATIPGNGVPCDFVTGGGWIMSESGDKANFGVGGGVKNGAFWGHLHYNDHGTSPPIQVHGTAVTAYAPAGPNSRLITGTARVRGIAGLPDDELAEYKVTVTDNREPGRNSDEFFIIVGPYEAGGPLGGGNIQLHKGNASTTPPSPLTCAGNQG
jgi:hypothetical protein